MDQLLIGAALALLFTGGALTRLVPLLRVAAPLAMAALVGVAFSSTPWDAHWYDTWGLTVTAALTAIVIGAVVCEPASLLARALAWRPLALVGLVSYGLYLWDGFYLVAFRDGLALPVWARSAAILAATVATAGLSWRFVEQPVLRRSSAARLLRASVPDLSGDPDPVRAEHDMAGAGVPG